MWRIWWKTSPTEQDNWSLWKWRSNRISFAKNACEFIQIAKVMWTIKRAKFRVRKSIERRRKIKTKIWLQWKWFWRWRRRWWNFGQLIRKLYAWNGRWMGRIGRLIRITINKVETMWWINRGNGHSGVQANFQPNLALNIGKLIYTVRNEKNHGNIHVRTLLTLVSWSQVKSYCRVLLWYP